MLLSGRSPDRHAWKPHILPGYKCLASCIGEVHRHLISRQKVEPVFEFSLHSISCHQNSIRNSGDETGYHLVTYMVMKPSQVSELIGMFKVVPKELFRVNRGTDVSLRAIVTRPKRKFDLLTVNGIVVPKALDPKTYIGELSMAKLTATVWADVTSSQWCFDAA